MCSHQDFPESWTMPGTRVKYHQTWRKFTAAGDVSRPTYPENGDDQWVINKKTWTSWLPFASRKGWSLAKNDASTGLPKQTQEQNNKAIAQRLARWFSWERLGAQPAHQSIITMVSISTSWLRGSSTSFERVHRRLQCGQEPWLSLASHGVRMQIPVFWPWDLI